MAVCVRVSGIPAWRAVGGDRQIPAASRPVGLAKAMSFAFSVIARLRREVEVTCLSYLWVAVIKEHTKQTANSDKDNTGEKELILTHSSGV